MWSVPYRSPHDQTLELWGQQLKHGLARDERSGTEGDWELVPGAVVIPNGLTVAFGHCNPIQRGHAWWVVFVQCSIDVPSVETGIPLGFICLGDAGFVEGSVGGVFEGSSSEAFVISHSTVADKLNLGHARDGLEIWVENRLLRRLGLVVAVPIAFGLRIERLNGGDEARLYGEKEGITLVSAYCCSGVSVTLRNNSAPCWWCTEFETEHGD